MKLKWEDWGKKGKESEDRFVERTKLERGEVLKKEARLWEEKERKICEENEVEEE